MADVLPVRGFAWFGGRIGRGGVYAAPVGGTAVTRLYHRRNGSGGENAYAGRSDEAYAPLCAGAENGSYVVRGLAPPLAGAAGKGLCLRSVFAALPATAFGIAGTAGAGRAVTGCIEKSVCPADGGLWALRAAGVCSGAFFCIISAWTLKTHYIYCLKKFIQYSSCQTNT